jgi:uroporphyrinogen-III decarboxylase
MGAAVEKTLGGRLIDDWIAGSHLEFADTAARERYQQRAQLIVDTIRLRDTGVIPVIPAATQKFAFEYGPVSFREAMTDFDKVFAAYVRQYEDTDFDAYVGPEFIYPAGMFEALQWNRMRLPGVHLPPERSFQFVEGEYMKADEYDDFLDDPSDWVLRKYLPRLSPKLEPLASLPPLHNMIMYYQGLPDLVLAAAENPAVVDAMRALKESGEAVQRWYEYLGRIDQELGGRLGLPHLLGAVSHAPFDIISNYYRGWRGAIGDMYRRPQKMIELMERLLPWQIEYGIEGARAFGHPIVTLYIYKGADVFMSDDQFKELYWPTLKRLIMALVDQGLLVWVFTQGTYDSRLHYFKEIPAGTCLIHLESGTDAFRAKEVLGGHQCIEGNVPNSLLATGSLESVESYCAKLTEVCGKGGGFMLDYSAFLDEAKPENVKKMIEVGKAYGREKGEL